MPSPEWVFGLLLTHVVPIVLLCMVAGGALGLLRMSPAALVRHTTASATCAESLRSSRADRPVLTSSERDEP